MKKQCIHHWVKILLIAFFLASMPAWRAYAEDPQDTDTGRLGILLDERVRAKLPTDSIVELSFYRIGGLDEKSGGWKMLDGFTDYGILESETTSDLVEIAARIAADLSANGSREPPQAVVKLLNGRGSVSNLPLGIYLGMLKNGPNNLTVDPFILSLPNMEEENILDYAITLKAVYSPPGEDPQKEDGKEDEEQKEDGTDGEKDDVPKEENEEGSSETEKGKSDGKKTGTAKQQTGKTTSRSGSVKTGDDSRTAFWMTLLLTSLAGLMILIVLRRKGSSKQIGQPVQCRDVGMTGLTERQAPGRIKPFEGATGGDLFGGRTSGRDP